MTTAGRRPLDQPPPSALRGLPVADFEFVWVRSQAAATNFCVIYHIPYWPRQFRTGHHHERWCRSHHALTYAYAYAYTYVPAHTRPRPPAGLPQLDQRCR